jgi:hypothetical protein
MSYMYMCLLSHASSMSPPSHPPSFIDNFVIIFGEAPLCVLFCSLVCLYPYCALTFSSAFCSEIISAHVLP